MHDARMQVVGGDQAPDLPRQDGRRPFLAEQIERLAGRRQQPHQAGMALSAPPDQEDDEAHDDVDRDEEERHAAEAREQEGDETMGPAGRGAAQRRAAGRADRLPPLDEGPAGAAHFHPHPHPPLEVLPLGQSQHPLR